MLFIYSHNNSGGTDWLDPEEWENLQKAGWTLPTFAGSTIYNDTAKKDFPNFESALAEWEKITGADFYEEGCECCGCPHSFRDENGTVY